MKIINNHCTIQGVNGSNDLFSSNNVKCFEINNFPLNGHQKNFANGIRNLQKTLGSLERSFNKTSKCENKLLQCKNTHNHIHNDKCWNNEPIKRKRSKYSPTPSSSTTNSKSDVHYVETEPSSTNNLKIKCLQYQLEDLSNRYETLLQAYEDQCSVLTVSDMKLAQWRQTAAITHAHLEHAHMELLTIGEKYLALKFKRHTLKAEHDDRVARLKSTLHDVVEVTAREQLRFDATLSYCLSNEHCSDAALLLYEIRKCNLLFLENMQLKTVIEELLPGYWKKC